MRRLHGQMFFLYGAVVGLALREAFVRVGPDLVSFLSSTVEHWKIHLEAARLTVFLFTISTFYVGSVIFFDRVHVSDDSEKSYPKSNYAYDFWFGLIHFVLFFLCAITINDFSQFRSGLSLFVVYLSSIFLYDLLWLVANLHQDSVDEIKVWAWSGTVTLFFAWVAFRLVKGISRNAVFGEYAILLVVFIYILIDLAELMTGNQIFSTALLRLLMVLLRLLPRRFLASLGIRK